MGGRLGKRQMKEEKRVAGKGQGKEKQREGGEGLGGELIWKEKSGGEKGGERGGRDNGAGLQRKM